jgi:hypothetical protein
MILIDDKPELKDTILYMGVKFLMVRQIGTKGLKKEHLENMNKYLAVPSIEELSYYETGDEGKQNLNSLKIYKERDYSYKIVFKISKEVSGEVSDEVKTYLINNFTINEKYGLVYKFSGTGKNEYFNFLHNRLAYFLWHLKSYGDDKIENYYFREQIESYPSFCKIIPWDIKLNSEYLKDEFLITYDPSNGKDHPVYNIYTSDKKYTVKATERESQKSENKLMFTVVETNNPYDRFENLILNEMVALAPHKMFKEKSGGFNNNKLYLSKILKYVSKLTEAENKKSRLHTGNSKNKVYLNKISKYLKHVT